MSLSTLFHQFINRDINLSEISSTLTSTGCSQIFIQSVITESTVSFSYLKNLAEKSYSDDELNNHLRVFLKKRWACIQRGNASYTSYPHSPINQICIALAEAIVKPEEAIAQILMPSLKIVEYQILFESLRELTEKNEGGAAKIYSMDIRAE